MTRRAKYTVPSTLGLPTLHMDPYERGWLVVSLVVLVLFGLTVLVSAFGFGFQVPIPVGQVNPNTVSREGVFANPGLRELAPGKYEAYILAQIWSWTPREITIPAGSEVTFYVTSKDVQHGFELEGTNINMQIVPGQVAKLSHRFDQPGEYNYVCHEYCGAGHAAMYGKLIVTP
jgi:cytochrome c oxidase subunit II